MTDDRSAIRAGLSDVNALTCTLYGEAAGEPLIGQIGVACVIRNRVLADIGQDGKPDWWGEGYRGVCLAPAQFSCWWEQNANTDRVYTLAKQLIVSASGILPELQWVAHGVVEGQIQDHTNGADHYVAATLFRYRPPTWAKGKTPVASLGNHVFFRLG